MSENHQKCTCKLFSHDENAYLFIRSNNADFTKYVDYVNKDKKTGDTFFFIRRCSEYCQQVIAYNNFIALSANKQYEILADFVSQLENDLETNPELF